MQLILAFVLTVAALVVATLFIRPGVARQPAQPMLYAPLGMALLAVVALLAPTPLDFVHKGAIVLGLILALIAVVFFSLEGTPPVVGFAQMLITYMLYFVASAVLTAWGWPTPWELVVLLIAGLLYWQL
ncbi:MAG TPA: hypothetical protein PKE45_26210, partial [Caldilineaceae bacterium]|nr:hypothetical protein [Caldilineaceae bacterium]